MGETEKDLIYSESVKAGKRIYYFDVKQSRNGDKYIAITESKKINEGTMDNPRFVFEKHKLFLYKEDYEKFVDALNRTLDVAKGNVSVAELKAAQEARAQEESVSAPVEVAEPAASEEPASEEKGEKKSFLDKVKDIF
ncbi:MAG: DUF3276 family protein [Bacteroidaceae bacterium]|nr:DUF3276 family protein [Bacteroidaceae bacterium]